MTALVLLGARLVRAGGPLRLWSVVGGCAAAVAVLATAWSLPDALYPLTDPEAVDPRRGPFVALTQGLVVPVLALVLTVGRLSSQVRDRRLAALRLVGVSPRHAAVVAVVENLVPAAAGALLGVGGYLALRAGTGALLDEQLRTPLTLAAPRLVLVVVGVVAASVALALAPLRRIGGEPRAGHVVSAVRRPSVWRLAPLVPAVAAFGYVLSLGPRANNPMISPVLLGGLLSGAIAIALVTPLLSYVLAGRLIRSERLVHVLAGRGTQTSPASVARRVVALGLAVYVALGGAGMIGVVEGMLHVRAAIHQIETGPQEIMVDDVGLTPGLVREVEAVPGVRAVIPRYMVGAAGCEDGAIPATCALDVFVGTCADLSATMAVQGCRDDAPAWVESDLTGYEDSLVPAVRVHTLELADERRTLGSVRLDRTLTQDVPATVRDWVWPGATDVFVPVGLVESWGARPAFALVVADAGTEVREGVREVAERHGGYADATYLMDYERVVATRTAAGAVMGVGITVALLAYGLAVVDRAREQRRPRARLVALGVPASLLRRVGTVQNLLPLVTTVVLAVVLALVATAAISHLADQRFAIAPAVGLGLVGVTVLGAVLVSTATTPLTRGRVRAEDLREE